VHATATNRLTQRPEVKNKTNEKGKERPLPAPVSGVPLRAFVSGLLA
jgi:hypothetical protein